MKTVWAAMMAAAALMVLTATAAAQGTEMTWTVDGVERVALVFAPAAVPASLTAKPLPLVFVFHGHGGTMQTASQGLHLHAQWPEAIVVYPQGLPTVSSVDPQGMRSGWQTHSGQNGNRDLKFFDAMLAGLRKKFAVDDQRIYSTGFSNGAVFSYLLWAERGRVLAALGICAGRVPATAHLSEPRAAIVIGGRSDPILPFSDQERGIEDARHADNATGAGQECGPGCTLYPSASHTPVVTRIHNGGHVFPPWAAAAIVEFFKDNKRP